MIYQFLGSFLLERGLATRAQIDEAAARQADTNRRLGDLAVEAGLLTPAQVEEIFTLQRDTDQSFGAIAVARGLVSRKDMDALVFRQSVRRTHLGEALLELGHLTPEGFSSALADYCERERSRRESVNALLASWGGDAPAGLVAALERSFLRFARCPLKAMGPLGQEELAALPYAFGSSIPLEGGTLFGFTLHLGADMLARIGRNASGEDLPEEDAERSVREMLGVICRYLRDSALRWTGFAPAGPEKPGPLRLKLACPDASLGLTMEKPRQTQT